MDKYDREEEEYRREERLIKQETCGRCRAWSAKTPQPDEPEGLCYEIDAGPEPRTRDQICDTGKFVKAR